MGPLFYLENSQTEQQTEKQDRHRPRSFDLDNRKEALRNAGQIEFHGGPQFAHEKPRPDSILNSFENLQFGVFITVFFLYYLDRMTQAMKLNFAYNVSNFPFILIFLPFLLSCSRNHFGRFLHLPPYLER